MPKFSHRRALVRLIAAIIVVRLLAAASASAQLPQTRIYAIDPPGAQIGSITEVTISRGDDLDEVDRLLFSHPGIFATPLMQHTANGPERVANRFRVAVASDVPPGHYEVRACGLFGLSNPRTFLIGRRPELRETEPNNTLEQAQSVPVGSVVNGFVNGAGDIDLFRFSVKASQRVILDCQALRIDSRLNPTLTLMDATGRPLKFSENEYRRDDLLVFDVPADGDYLVELRDLAYTGSADHVYRLAIHTAPHVRFVLPAAGQAGTTSPYSLYGYNLPGGERTDATSAGGPLERLAVNIALPPRESLDVSLPGVPSYAAGLDLFPYRLDAASGSSNTVLLGVTDGAVVVEQEPNNDAAHAQTIAAPVDMTGQFSGKRDVDVFHVQAKQGEELHIEVIGHRRGVPIDPLLTVEQVTVDEQGREQLKRLTTEDDVTSNLAESIFDTASDDPVFRLKAPAEGAYRLTLRDRAYEHTGSPDLVYRLIVRPPQPDFRLVALPAGSVAGQTWPISLRRGDHFAMDVLAFRRDGFSGPITIAASHLPPGLEVSELTIPEGQTTGMVVLTATANVAGEVQNVRLEGSAVLETPAGPKLLRHPVRAGSVTWNKADPMPAVSRLTDSLAVSVMSEPAPYLVTHNVPRIEAHQGRQILVPLTLARTYDTVPLGEQKSGLDSDLVLKPAGLPKDAKIEAGDVTVPKGQTAQTMRIFVTPESPPGTYRLYLNAQVQLPYRRNPAKAVRLEAAKTRALAKEQQLKTLLEQATAQATAIAAQVTQTTGQLQQTQQSIAANEKLVAEANPLVEQATAAVNAAAQNVTALEAQAKQAAAAAEAATKAAAGTDDAAVKAQAEPAQQAATKAAEMLAAAQAAAEQAKQQHQTAAAQLQQATSQLAAAQTALPQLQARLDSLNVEKQKADQRVQFRAQAVPPAEQARQAAEKAATDAATEANPKNVAVTQPLPPLEIVVKPAPVRLTVTLTAAEVKRGESVDATLTITRQNEFAGPVTFSLPRPEGAKDLTAAPVTVAADATTGVLKLTADAQAAAGDVPFLALRATVDHGGEALVDAPIAIKVIE
jgi:hypothetical protein